MSADPAVAAPLIEDQGDGDSTGPPRTTSKTPLQKPAGKDRKKHTGIRKCMAKCLRNWPVIDPRESELLAMWDKLMVLILFLNTFCAPYETAFLELETHGIFLLACAGDVVFCCDMFLQLFTAEPDPKRPGFYIKDPVVMFEGYLTGWFLLDLATVVPPFFECYLYWDKPQSAPLFMRLVRLCRMCRLRSVYQIGNRMNSSMGLNNHIASMLWFVGVACVCSHWMACLWGGIAFQSQKFEGSHTWLDACRAAKGGPDDLYQTGSGVYTMSLYWAIVTLTSIGYGDIVPQTEFEYWINLVCMMVMAWVWAYVIGQICGLVATLNPHEVNFKQTMDDLNWLMQDRGIPSGSRKKFRRYFHESQNLQRLEEQKAIVDRMSPMLQGEVSMQMLGSWVTKIPYLVGMPSEILCRIARKLVPLLYAPNEHIPPDRALFIVRRGMCCYGGKILVGGDVWGEDMILANPVLRKCYDVRCLSYLEVLTLRQKDLCIIVSHDKDAQETIRWCAVKLSTMRAYGLLARLAGVWNTIPNVKPLYELESEHLMRLIKAVLNGTFDIQGTEPDALQKTALALKIGGINEEECQRKDGVPVRTSSNATLDKKQSVDSEENTLSDLYNLLMVMQEKIEITDSEIADLKAHASDTMSTAS